MDKGGVGGLGKIVVNRVSRRESHIYFRVSTLTVKTDQLQSQLLAGIPQLIYPKIMFYCLYNVHIRICPKNIAKNKHFLFESVNENYN